MTISLAQAILTASRSMPADNGYALVPDAALRVLIEHAQTVEVHKATTIYRPNAHVIRRLLERLDANTSWGVERLRDFDWGDAPVPTSTPPEAPTLRDQFMMAALTGIAAHPVGPVKHLGETNAQAHARWALTCADAAMTARTGGAK